MNQTHGATGAQPPSENEAERRLIEGLERLDTVRADGLERAGRIQRTQAAGATRERDRLAAKYGEGHPRVREAGARVAAEGRLAEAVQAQAEQARTPPPKADADTWVVQGRVVRATGEPAAGLTVSLSQPGGGWERAAGHVCTDRNGAFTLRHRPQTGRARLELVVSDGGTTLHRDPQPLTPVAGTIDSRLIVLDERAGACPPPEQAPEKERGRDTWRVRGRITRADGTPAAGVTVSLYDKDLIFDDRLGTTTTSADGEYRFTYRTSDFRDFIERRPDLYVKVLDVRGRTLHSTRAKVRYEAGREEVIDVQLPRQAGER